MADKDNSVSQVEEQPTTYNKRFQIVLIAGFVLVVIIMVYGSLFRSTPRGSGIEGQVQRELKRQAVPDSQTEFREQIKNQEQRLQKQRAQDVSEQRKYMDERAGELLQNNERALQELLTVAKSPMEAWNENEVVRVRQSRQAEFNFDFFAGSASGIGYQASGIGTGPDEFLKREQAALADLRQRFDLDPTAPDEFLKREQAALADLRQRFDLDPTALDGRGDSLSRAGSLSDLLAQATGAGNNTIDVPRSFNLAGYPESDLTGPPGDGFELLSIGSVMSAKLDQKVISDYAGPYRCRIEQNVMDVAQKFVLIPAGSLCTGEVIQTGAGHPNRIINNRMALSVRWIVRPDGTKIKFVSNVLDHEGIGAIKGKTDYHFLARFGGTAAFAILSGETSRPDFSANGSGATFKSEAGQALREAGADVASQYAGLVPTQTLNYGQKLRLFVSEDIYISPWRGVYQRLMSQR